MLEEAFCAVVFPVHAVEADSFQFPLYLPFRDAAAAVGVFQRVRYRKRFTHDRASYARAAYHCGRSARVEVAGPATRAWPKARMSSKLILRLIILTAVRCKLLAAEL